MKCKGCTEQIDYWPLARVLAERPQDYYSAGPALTHSGEACEWFKATDTGVIKACIENHNAGRVTPLPALAIKNEIRS